MIVTGVMLTVMMKKSMMTLTVELLVCRPVMRLSSWKELSMMMLTPKKLVMSTPVMRSWELMMVLMADKETCDVAGACDEACCVFAMLSSRGLFGTSVANHLLNPFQCFV